MKTYLLRFSFLCIPFLMIIWIGQSKVESYVEARPIIYGNSLYSEIVRADIKDRTGIVLAYDKKIYNLWLDKKNLPYHDEWIARLSQIIHMNSDDIMNLLTETKQMVLLKQRLEDREIKDIRNLNIKGLAIIESFERVYPYSSLIADVVGNVGRDHRGLQGVEFYYDNFLRGFHSKDENNENHLALSIYSGIQFKAHNILLDKLKKHKASRGFFTLMDMENGEILAMTSASLNKEMAWASSIRNSIDPSTALVLLHVLKAHAQGNPVSYGNKYICSEAAEDFSICSPWDLKELGEMSLDQDMFKYLLALGFGSETGLDIPGEKSGSLIGGFTNTWDFIKNKGIQSTSIQMLRAFASMINRGKLVTPHVTINEGAHLKKSDFWSIPSSNNDGNSIPPIEEITLTMRQQLASSGFSGLVSANQYSKDLSQLVFLGFEPVLAPQFVYIMVIEDAKQRGQSQLFHTLQEMKNLASRNLYPDKKDPIVSQKQVMSYRRK